MIASGCNYAMSKLRVNIHALDPAVVAIKAATTPFDKIVYPKDIFDYTVSKERGIGGIESYGKMRLLF
jgi:spore coat assembly protein